MSGNKILGDNEKFQTPMNVVNYMVSMIPEGAKQILEPTAGSGNIVKGLINSGKNYDIHAPQNFFEIEEGTCYDCVLMNPPFSSKYAFGVPENFEHRGMRLGYYILLECMKKSQNIIALMPWFTISDSDVRLRYLKNYGLKSITALPRKTFQYARIQTCIFELEAGYKADTIFKVFDLEMTN